MFDKSYIESPEFPVYSVQNTRSVVVPGIMAFTQIPMYWRPIYRCLPVQAITTLSFFPTPTEAPAVAFYVTGCTTLWRPASTAYKQVKLLLVDLLQRAVSLKWMKRMNSILRPMIQTMWYPKPLPFLLKSHICAQLYRIPYVWPLSTRRLTKLQSHV